MPIRESTLELALARYDRQTSTVWAYIGVPDNLPPVGWKVHVSFTAEWAAVAAQRIADFCKAHCLHGKIVRSIEELEKINSGVYYPAQQIGKTATIYFPSAAKLALSCLELTHAMQFTGPPVLTDRRIVGSTCLSARYSAFSREAYLHGEDHRPPAQDEDALRGILEPAEPMVPDGFRKVSLVKLTGKGYAFFAYDDFQSSDVFVKTGFYFERVMLSNLDGASLVQKEEEAFAWICKNVAISTPNVYRSFRFGSQHVSVREVIKGPDLHRIKSVGSSQLVRRVGDAIRPQLEHFYTVLEACGACLMDISPTSLVVDQDFKLFLVDAEYFYIQEQQPPNVMTLLSSTDASFYRSYHSMRERFDWEKRRLLSFIDDLRTA